MGRTLTASRPLFTDVHFVESLKIEFFSWRFWRKRSCGKKDRNTRDEKNVISLLLIFYDFEHFFRIKFKIYVQKDDIDIFNSGFLINVGLIF